MRVGVSDSCTSRALFVFRLASQLLPVLVSKDLSFRSLAFDLELPSQLLNTKGSSASLLIFALLCSLDYVGLGLSLAFPLGPNLIYTCVVLLSYTKASFFGVIFMRFYFLFS